MPVSKAPSRVFCLIQSLLISRLEFIMFCIAGNHCTYSSDGLSRVIDIHLPCKDPFKPALVSPDICYFFTSNSWLGIAISLGLINGTLLFFQRACSAIPELLTENARLIVGEFLSLLPNLLPEVPGGYLKKQPVENGK